MGTRMMFRQFLTGESHPNPVTHPKPHLMLNGTVECRSQPCRLHGPSIQRLDSARHAANRITTPSSPGVLSPYAYSTKRRDEHPRHPRPAFADDIISGGESGRRKRDLETRCGCSPGADLSSPFTTLLFLYLVPPPLRISPTHCLSLPTVVTAQACPLACRLTLHAS